MSYIKPSVKMGKPRNLKNYNLHNVDNISVYVKSDVKTKNNSLEIKYSKKNWIKKLIVAGMIFKA